MNLKLILKRLENSILNLLDKTFKKMRFIFAISIFLFFNKLNADINLIPILENLNKPWSVTLINEKKLLITEKSGNILLFDRSEKIIKKINHNLNVLEHGQGGLLDILFKNKKVYVSYAENRGNGKSSTSVAVAKFNEDNLKFVNIFQAQPPINSGYHFGSRLVLKKDKLYISAGERGGGIIAQDPSQHPGSIIRINIDGSIPSDNPKFLNRKEWLPEIYQIGIRNVQGMALSPFDGEIYMTNHGPRGGDWFGTVNKGGNYGWDKLYWGGTKYSGLKGGPKWLPGFDKPIKYYVPSIATSAMLIYKGNEFEEWNGKALISALKDKSIRIVTFKKNKFLNEEIIFKDKIGRIRDIKLDHKGRVLVLTDQGVLWLLSKI